MRVSPETSASRCGSDACCAPGGRAARRGMTPTAVYYVSAYHHTNMDKPPQAEPTAPGKLCRTPRPPRTCMALSSSFVDPRHTTQTRDAPPSSLAGWRPPDSFPPARGHGSMPRRTCTLVRTRPADGAGTDRSRARARRPGEGANPTRAHVEVCSARHVHHCAVGQIQISVLGKKKPVPISPKTVKPVISFENRCKFKFQTRLR
jgi:hypothetical protein